jgi:magnesium chelatase family protein
MNYRKRLSGPLLDRIDLMIEVPKVPTEKLVDTTPGETSAIVRERVYEARQRQQKRYADLHVFTNAELTSEQVRGLIAPSPEAQSLLRQAVDRYRLSARAYFRVLKVSRTIADLAQSEDISTQHVAEALHYRQAIEL